MPEAPGKHMAETFNLKHFSRSAAPQSTMSFRLEGTQDFWAPAVYAFDLGRHARAQNSNTLAVDMSHSDCTPNPKCQDPKSQTNHPSVAPSPLPLNLKTVTELPTPQSAVLIQGSLPKPHPEP